MARTQYQVSAKPPQIPIFPVNNDNSSEVIFTREFQYDAFTVGSPPILPSFGYFRPLSEPVRRNPPPIITAQQKFFDAGFLPILPSFGYYNPFQDPIRRKASNLLDSVQFVPLVSETITVDKWFSPFGEVTRAKPYKFTLPDSFFDVGDVLQNLIPVSLEFPEIIFTRQFQYQVSAFTALTETINMDKWYRDFVPLPNVAFTVSESVVDFVIQLPENITVDKWFVELSKPQILSKPLLGLGSQQFLSFVELIPSVTQDWFYYAFSEPIRFKPQLNTALQFYQESLTFLPSEDTFQDIRWFTALSEPVRYRWFPPSEQQSLLALTIPFNPAIGYADVIVQTWNVLPEVDTWVINLNLTGCDCDG